MKLLFSMLALVLLVVCGAFAQVVLPAGTSQASNAGEYGVLNLFVAVNNPMGDGAMELKINYVEPKTMDQETYHFYHLTFADRDKLVKLVQSAVRYVDVASTNKVTDPLYWRVGNIMTSDGVDVIANFDGTNGYNSCSIELYFRDGGNNINVRFSKAEIQSFCDSLENASTVATEYTRQIALFDSVRSN
jgi:hypothetical protein